MVIVAIRNTSKANRDTENELPSRDASGNGGAVYIVGTFDLINTSFVANTANMEGMAIFVAVLSASSRVDFTSVIFENNAYCCPLGQYSYDATDEVNNMTELQRYIVRL